MNATNTLKSQVIQESIEECQESISYYQNKLKSNKKNMSRMAIELINKSIRKERIKLRIFLEVASTETE